VVSILGCRADDVIIEGIRRANSFIVILAIKDALIGNILHMNQHHMEQLRDLNVDYFIVDDIKFGTDHFSKDKNYRQ
jgi:hypothetical protein